MDENQKAPATTHETVEAIVQSSKRSKATPLRRVFLQQKGKGERRSVPGPLARFVTAGDRTGILLYLLALTKASREPWDVSLPAPVWARALGFEKPTGTTACGRVSKAWTRLVEKNLVTRSKDGRLAKFTLLDEAGTGKPYDRPQKDYFRVPLALWNEGKKQERWFEILNLPELTFLIIALSNQEGFSLPAERGPDYYGISADTIERGVRGLKKVGLLDVRKNYKKAPLAPEGFTYENCYWLQPPFVLEDKIKLGKTEGP